MKRDLAKAVWDRFKTVRIDLKKIPSIDVQHAFVQEISILEPSKERAEEAEDDKDQNFERTVSTDGRLYLVRRPNLTVVPSV